MYKKFFVVSLILLAVLLCGCNKECTHENVEIVNKVEANCTESGYTGDCVCVDCNATVKVGEAVEPLEHQIEVSGAEAPTCTADGSTGLGICSVCNEVINEASAIAATGHSETRINTVEATCKEKGYSGDVVCESCGEVLSEGVEIEILDHDIITNGFKEATCTEDGYSGDRTCSRCGDVVEGGTILPKGHVTETKNHKNPTCSEVGYSGDVSCTKCGAELSKGSELPKLSHNPVTKNAKEVTCSSDGYSGDVYCSYCNMEISKGNVIKAEGHKNLTIRGEIAATSNADGYTGDTYCVACNELIKKGESVPKNPNVGSYPTVGNVEQQILNSMNSVRAAAGACTLAFDNALKPGTDIRANEYRYWGNEGDRAVNPHHRPNDQEYYTVFAEIGIASGSGIAAYQSHGEILAASSDSETLFDAWMNSPSHKSAIMNSVYTHVSISVIFANDMYYACAIFHN